MRRRLSKATAASKGGGHNRGPTHAAATRAEGGKAVGLVCADAPLHAGGAVPPPSRAQAQAQARAQGQARAQAQAQATPRVKRQLDFGGVTEGAATEGAAAAPGPVEVLRAEAPQLLSCTELGRLLDSLLKNKFV